MPAGKAGQYIESSVEEKSLSPTIGSATAAVASAAAAVWWPCAAAKAAVMAVLLYVSLLLLASLLTLTALFEGGRQARPSVHLYIGEAAIEEVSHHARHGHSLARSEEHSKAPCDTVKCLRCYSLFLIMFEGQIAGAGAAVCVLMLVLLLLQHASTCRLGSN